MRGYSVTMEYIEKITMWDNVKSEVKSAYMWALAWDKLCRRCYVRRSWDKLEKAFSRCEAAIKRGEIADAPEHYVTWHDVIGLFLGDSLNLLTVGPHTHQGVPQKSIQEIYLPPSELNRVRRGHKNLLLFFKPKREFVNDDYVFSGDPIPVKLIIRGDYDN